MRTALATALLIVLAAPAVASEPAPAASPDTSIAAAVGPVPTLRSTTEAATISRASWLETEFAYATHFAALRLPQRRDLHVHSGELQVSYAPTETIETRVGWEMFLVSGREDFGRVGGVGNPYFDAKFGIGVPEIDWPHAVAIRARIELGIGQELATDGATFSGLGMYSIRLNQFDVDANVGLAVNTAKSPAYVSMPLSGRGTWRATSAFEVFVEFVETLRFDDLRSSETEFFGGVGFRPLDALVLDVSSGVGLSEHVPAAVLRVGLTWLASEVGP